MGIILKQMHIFTSYASGIEAYAEPETNLLRSS